MDINLYIFSLCISIFILYDTNLEIVKQVHIVINIYTHYHILSISVLSYPRVFFINSLVLKKHIPPTDIYKTLQ